VLFRVLITVFIKPIVFVFLSINFSVYAISPLPVILISIDGLANDYLKLYQPKNILALANSGVKAKALLPVYPSKTFPNHLSIVTGVYPAKHGIIHNKFYRPDLHKQYTLGAGKEHSEWLTAMPIWTVAEKQGIKTAIYFWPESEARIAGQLPSYYFPYQHNTPNLERINQLIDWLKLPQDKRPQLLLSYFSSLDSAGHNFGPDSIEVQQALHDIDNLIGLLMKRLKDEINQEVNVVLVSDHGMTSIEPNAIDIESLIPNNTLFTLVNGQTQLLIYSDYLPVIKKIKSQLLSNPIAIRSKYRVYLKNDYPKHWQMKGQLKAIPDLIVEAIAPATFTDQGKQMGAATHGFDPKMNRNLDAIFIANGPSFNTNQVIEAFENIHIYPLLIEVLGLDNINSVDGDIKVLKPIIRKKANLH